MRTVFILSCTLFVAATSSFGQLENSSMFHSAQGASEQYYPNPDAVVGRPLHINPNFPQVGSIAASLPRGATHLIVRSDADARQIFSYYICPGVAARSGAVGVYRLEVNSEGNVAAVTILKSMGARRDTRIMKTLVGWRAKSGPPRIVDISLRTS